MICGICNKEMIDSVISGTHLDTRGAQQPLVHISNEGFLHIHDVYMTHKSNTPTVRRSFVNYWHTKYGWARWRWSVARDAFRFLKP